MTSSNLGIKTREMGRELLVIFWSYLKTYVAAISVFTVFFFFYAGIKTNNRDFITFLLIFLGVGLAIGIGKLLSLRKQFWFNTRYGFRLTYFALEAFFITKAIVFAIVLCGFLLFSVDPESNAFIFLFIILWHILGAFCGVLAFIFKSGSHIEEPFKTYTEQTEKPIRYKVG